MKISKHDLIKVKQLITRVMGTLDIIDIERMGGLTNRTYHVTAKQGDYAVRLPGEGTGDMIIRREEKKSTELACKLGIDAKLYFFDAESGEKVSDYIVNSKTMDAFELRKIDNIKHIAKIFARLHRCGEDTGVSFDVIDMAETYEHIIRKGGGFFYEDYEDIKRYIESLKKEYLPGVVKVPCHNDPLCENWLLQNKEKMFLIDWEYSGMNDPMWDLADVSIEADYTPEMDELLLINYLGHTPEAKEWRSFRINKVLIDYLWSLWGKARAVYDGEELEKYAFYRYLRMKDNMRNLLEKEKKMFHVL